MVAEQRGVHRVLLIGPRRRDDRKDGETYARCAHAGLGRVVDSPVAVVVRPIAHEGEPVDELHPVDAVVVAPVDTAADDRGVEATRQAWVSDEISRRSPQNPRERVPTVVAPVDATGR